MLDADAMMMSDVGARTFLLLWELDRRFAVRTA
jgi:hypothetical protein